MAPAISQRIANFSKANENTIKPLVSEGLLLESFEKSRELLMKYQDLMEALFYDVNPIPIKAALKMIGFDCGNCRLPLVKMDPEKEIKLRNIVSKHGFLS
jgi:dihydrodipicolinate synthase/N-acetylneuraminate lyase